MDIYIHFSFPYIECAHLKEESMPSPGVVIPSM